MATISKTASDHRTGDNSASIICQKCYKNRFYNLNSDL